jgi:IS5 family transposase
MKQKGLFDEEERLRKLSAAGDPLEKIAANINWEIFRPVLKKAFKKVDAQNKRAGGRPPYDRVLMYKIVQLQQWYNLSDDNAERMILDRLTFQRFLGLSLKDSVPDAKTIWAFKETLAKKGTAEELNALFTKQLEEEGLITHSGSIIDATFVEAPRQRNTREENASIKKGELPENWKADENDHSKEVEKLRHKLRRKDTDARWTKKRNETHYGYKDHVKVDKDSKLIVRHIVTHAAVHDSQKAAELIDGKDKEVWEDAGYVGEDVEKAALEKNPKLVLHVCEKGYRNKPLSEEQKANNREKSRVRSRVEHVFGYMTNSMGGLTVRCVGIVRAASEITLKNLAYNMSRYVFLKTQGREKGNGRRCQNGTLIAAA